MSSILIYHLLWILISLAIAFALGLFITFFLLGKKEKLSIGLISPLGIVRFFVKRLKKKGALNKPEFLEDDDQLIFYLNALQNPKNWQFARSTNELEFIMNFAVNHKNWSVQYSAMESIVVNGTKAWRRKIINILKEEKKKSSTPKARGELVDILLKMVG